MPLKNRRHLLRVAVVAAIAAIEGCGTVLHPERKGQPAGRIDWRIFALDAVGLILFFIPGVIAFAVDFNNGTIYLPPDSQAGTDSNTSSGLTKVSVPKNQLNRRRIEQVVANHSGHQIQLDEHRAQTHRLDSVDQFWPMHHRLFKAS